MSTTVKRVISHPEEVGRDHTKISRQSSQSQFGSKEDNLTPAMGSLTLISDLQRNNSDENIATTTDNNIAEITGMESVDDDGIENLAKKDSNQSSLEGKKPSAEADVEATALEENQPENSGFARQVSVDTSNNIQPNTIAPPKVIEVINASGSSTSVIRNKSESTVSSAAGTSAAAKDWGWFEDIHDHNSKGNKSPDGDKKGRRESTKKTGLLLFDDLVNPINAIVPSVPKKKNEDKDVTMMAVTAPTYVLEESKSSQQLWKNTAGTRPPQPVEERAFYEKIWAQNFERSQVDYKIPADVLTATSPISLSPFADGNFSDVGQPGPNDYIGTNSERTGAAEVAAVSSVTGKAAAAAGFYGSSSRSKNRTESMMEPHNHHHTLVNKKVKDDGTDDELTVLVRGDNVFGTTVSKSFTTDDSKRAIDTVSISIASYRVVESKKHGKYAQFLVIFCEGTFRDTVGVWKRYSDFEQLSRRVTHGQENCTSVFAGINPLEVTEEHHEEMLPNAITSWNLLKKRKRWYRCLDAGYLSLKAFLLERFLHDILFESSTAQILRDFVGFKNEEH